MNKIIENQLSQVKIANIEYGDQGVIYIPKTVKSNYNLKVGEIHVIEINDEILNPPESSLLVSNWNSGKIPKYKKYQVEILDIVHRMVKINGVAIIDNCLEYSENFYGWLPIDSFKIINDSK